IEVGASNTLVNAPLRIDEQILHYLMGCPHLDESLISIFEPLGTEDIPMMVDSHRQLAGEITATWQHTSGILPIIQLCGSNVGSKRAIAQTVCAQLGFNLYVLAASNLPNNPHELYQLLKRWERETVLNKSIALVKCDINTSDTGQLNKIEYLIESITSPLIIATSDRLSAKQQTMLTYDVEKPTTNEQRTIWKQVLGEKAVGNGLVDNLVSQFNLTAPDIYSAYVKAVGMGNIEIISTPRHLLQVGEPAQRSGSSPPSTPSPHSSPSTPSTPSSPSHSFSNLLWNSCRTQAQPKLDELAQRIKASATWDDLVLGEVQMQTLQSIAAHIRQRIQVYEKWGFAGKGKRGLGISALFAGVSGTGKTMSAEVLAHELQLDVYRIDLSTVVSKYIGETEKNLRRIFDAAEGGGAILLFDEADALFGKRSDVKDARDRYANMEVSYLLQRMEEYQGLAILTTNLKDSIDTAFLRRIRFIVKYSFPDAKQRQEIWRRIFPKDTPTKELDYPKLARLNVAGGNIRNIALNAAFIAADAGEAVMMKHIKLAAQNEYVKLERTLTDAEVKGWV
ncbi:MAG: ATP-binding protein, partial [Cyanobacteria bacterium J06635_10]